MKTPQIKTIRQLRQEIDARRRESEAKLSTLKARAGYAKLFYSPTNIARRYLWDIIEITGLGNILLKAIRTIKDMLDTKTDGTIGRNATGE